MKPFKASSAQTLLTEGQVAILKKNHLLLSRDSVNDRRRIDRSMNTRYYRVVINKRTGPETIGASVDPLVAIAMMVKHTHLIKVEL